MFLWFFVLFVFNQSLACFFVRWFCVWYIFVCNTSVYNTSVCVWYICICDTSVYHTSFTLMWSRQWRHAFGILVSVAAALQKSCQLANEANGKECICLQCAVSKFFAWRGVEFWRSTCWHISAHFRSTCDSEQRDRSIKQIPLFRLSSCWILDQLVENFQAVFFRLFDACVELKNDHFWPGLESIASHTIPT